MLSISVEDIIRVFIGLAQMGNVISIIGCGASSEGWYKHPHDYSIGVNDMKKFGHDPDSLLICNWPLKFPQHRLNIIKETNPKRFFSNTDAWRTYFPQMEKIYLRSWDGHFYKDYIVHTDTSPTIAMGLARSMGATEIVLWGCDYIDHHMYHKNNNSTELRQIKAICEALKNEGVKIYLGASGSALETFLPIKK